jgi:SAM-dependent methyltransferase
MPEPSVEDLVARLERERQDADRLYNEALTLVDRAIQSVPPLPGAARPYEEHALAEANKAWNILPEGPPAIDRSLKGRLRTFIWRMIGPPLETQKHFNAALIDHLNRNAAFEREIPEKLSAVIAVLELEMPRLVRFESLLVQFLQTITIYVDSKDRSIGGTDLRERLALAEQRLLALKRDVEALGRYPGQADRGPAAPWSAAVTTEASAYVGFEDRFRGAKSEIRRRVEDYVPLLAAQGDVVDIGCGRGELLELLRQRGVKAKGIDSNVAMVDLCRAAGLDVTAGDALAVLDGQPDGSIGGLSAIQVVEHFEPAYLARFLETAHHKMRPGAPLILETVNASCWMAFFETYIRDLTHQRPLHPDTLRFLVQASGFQSVDVQFRSPVSESDRLQRVSGVPASGEAAFISDLARVINAHADALNARLFSSMDYAIIARR